MANIIVRIVSRALRPVILEALHSPHPAPRREMPTEIGFVSLDAAKLHREKRQRWVSACRQMANLEILELADKSQPPQVGVDAGSEGFQEGAHSVEHGGVSP